MPKPIPYEVRLKMVRDRQAGKSFAQIAQQTGYSVSGVKKIWRIFQSQGQAGLQLQYKNCGRKSPYKEEIRELIAATKNGDQGAPYIRSILEYYHPDKDIPHERTIQRWWKAQGTNRNKIIRKRQKNNWSKEVHHTWQVDGKEQIHLGTGDQVSWMNIADEASSSVLSTVIFPPKSDDTNSTSTSNSSDQ